jgi:hypothetical protein
MFRLLTFLCKNTSEFQEAAGFRKPLVSESRWFPKAAGFRKPLVSESRWFPKAAM